MSKADDILNEFLADVPAAPAPKQAPEKTPETKLCLDCSMQIPFDAKKCPHCNEWQQDAKRILKRQKAAATLSHASKYDASDRINRTYIALNTIRIAFTTISVLIVLFGIYLAVFSAIYGIWHKVQFSVLMITTVGSIIVFAMLALLPLFLGEMIKVALNIASDAKHIADNCKNNRP